MPRDRITVFDLTSGRDHIIQPVLNELRLQGNAEKPSQLVNVDGRVKVPGEYPLEPGMTVADLVRAGGGTTDGAYGGKAELVRYRVVNGEARRTELVNIDLSAALHGDPAANLKLQPFDTLSIKEVPEWESQESVTLRGEVRFPGSYVIRRGETLKSVLDRAGGLTAYAFAEGSVFTRDELRRREQEQLDVLADRMQRDVALLALQSAGGQPAGRRHSPVRRSVAAWTAEDGAGRGPTGDRRAAAGTPSGRFDLRRGAARWRYPQRAALSAAGHRDRRGAERHLAPVQSEAHAR